MSRGRRWTLRDFAAPTLEVARALIGCTLEHGECAGLIVEVEAYTDDAASHFVVRRNQGRVMAESHGQIYIYRSYGVHHCLNFTTDEHGIGAVLLRAIEPTKGVERMRKRRAVERAKDIASGPGKLVKALAVDPALNGEAVLDHFDISSPAGTARVSTSKRIGITRAVDLPWRFTLEGK